MGVEVVFDAIRNSSVGVHRLVACASSVRPMLVAAAREPEVVPVDVRVRLVRDVVPVPAEAIRNSSRRCDPLPTGTLLDCYM